MYRPNRVKTHTFAHYANRSARGRTQKTIQRTHRRQRLERTEKNTEKLFTLTKTCAATFWIVCGHYWTVNREFMWWVHSTHYTTQNNTFERFERLKTKTNQEERRKKNAWRAHIEILWSNESTRIFCVQTPHNRDETLNNEYVVLQAIQHFKRWKKPNAIRSVETLSAQIAIRCTLPYFYFSFRSSLTPCLSLIQLPGDGGNVSWMLLFLYTHKRMPTSTSEVGKKNCKCINK